MYVDNSSLRELAPPELALFLCRLIKDHPEESISAHLFSAVERQSLPPTLLSVWLSIARTPATLLEALTQEFSVHTRRIAIKRFFKLLRTGRWRETWDGVGGAPGLLTLLEGFSISEVKFCLNLFTRCLNGPDRTEKQTKVSEFLRILLPMIHHDARFKTSDERPLLRHYQLLLPGSNPEFVDETLRDPESPLPTGAFGRFENKTNSDLLREHHELLRYHCLDHIFTSTYTAIYVDDFLGPLLHYAPGLPSTERGFSESMAFSLLVLRGLASQPDIKVRITVLTDLVEPLLRRARKRKADPAMIREILDLSITHLASHPDEAKHLSFRPDCFLYICIRLWASSSDHGPECESILVSVLRIIPSDRNRNLRDYGTALWWVQRPLRYNLLKLLFEHAGGKTIDIDETASLKGLSTKNWPCGLFYCMNRDKAVELLKRLRNTSLRDDFLGNGSGILSHPTSQDLSGANSSILLNLLEEGQPGVLERATCELSLAQLVIIER
jgi:hypothetical protein